MQFWEQNGFKVVGTMEKYGFTVVRTMEKLWRRLGKRHTEDVDKISSFINP